MRSDFHVRIGERPLGLNLDGRQAVLTSTGSVLTLTTRWPYALLDGVAAAAVATGLRHHDRSCAVGTLANALNAAGLTLVIRTDQRPIVTLGGAGPSIGHRAWGSRNVVIHDPRAVLTIMDRRMRQLVIDARVHLSRRGEARAA